MPLVSVEQRAPTSCSSPDLNTQRRLRNVQTLGGAREAQFLRYGDKIT